MLQRVWNPYGSKALEREFCIERMSNGLLTLRILPFMKDAKWNM